MPNPTLETQLRDQFDRLSPVDQEKVLSFARNLATGLPRGIPGRDLLRFAGTIPARDLEEMARAIEEGCERVDADGW